MYLLLYIHTIRLCCLSEGCIRDRDFKKGVLVFCTVGVKVANEVVYIITINIPVWMMLKIFIYDNYLQDEYKLSHNEYYSAGIRAGSQPFHTNYCTI